MLDQILTYREMCDIEDVQTLQRGMNFRLNSNYSVILMSRRSNAPYRDVILNDGLTIEYEGHDEARSSENINPKIIDQPIKTKNSNFTQNGLFIKAIERYRQNESKPELVKAYEKLFPGVWSFKGYFNLIDYNVRFDGQRKVFIFRLKLSANQHEDNINGIDIEHTRLIPTEVKKHVWQRDKGKCVLCGSTKNLHFDHELPFSRGGASLTVDNIRILCAQCNLKKSDKIE